MQDILDRQALLIRLLAEPNDALRDIVNRILTTEQVDMVARMMAESDDVRAGMAIADALNAANARAINDDLERRKR